MRVFSAIVQPLVAPMLGVRQRPSNGWRVAGKLVGDHDAPLGAALAVKHPTQETLGSYLIASLLDKDVQYDSVLIDGSPEPVAVAADLERYFVQMPLVASSYSSSTQPRRVARAELRAPLADRLMADDDPTFGEEIPKVEMEPKHSHYNAPQLKRPASWLMWRVSAKGRFAGQSAARSRRTATRGRAPTGHGARGVQLGRAALECRTAGGSEQSGARGAGNHCLAPADRALGHRVHPRLSERQRAVHTAAARADRRPTRTRTLATARTRAAGSSLPRSETREASASGGERTITGSISCPGHLRPQSCLVRQPMS